MFIIMVNVIIRVAGNTQAFIIENDFGSTVVPGYVGQGP